MPYKEQTIQLGGYVPVAVKPKFTATSYLADSIKTLDARHQKALEQASAIDLALSKIQLNAAEDEWKANYINNIRQQIDNAAQYGSYSTALSTATRLAGKALSDPGLLGRERYQANYKNFIDKINANPKIDQDTKDWAIAQNPYNYKDKFNDLGDVIGGNDFVPNVTPVDQIDFNNVLAKVKAMVQQEQGQSTQVVFTDAYGNETTDPSKGVNDVRYYKNGSWQGISKQKFSQLLESAIDNTPGARAAIQQDWTVANWKYDRQSEEDKQNKPSTLFADNGKRYTFEEYYNNRFSRAVDNMTGINYSSSIKYDDDYSKYIAGLRTGQLQNNTGITDFSKYVITAKGTPVTIQTEDTVNKALGSAIGVTAELEKSYYELKKDPRWIAAKQRNDYNELANILQGSFRVTVLKDQKAISKIKELRNHASIVNSVLADRNINADAVLTNAAFTTGGELPNTKTGKRYLNIYNDLGGRDATQIEYTFNTGQELNDFADLLGIDKNKYKRGHDNGKETLTIPKEDVINYKALETYDRLGYTRSFTTEMLANNKFITLINPFFGALNAVHNTRGIKFLNDKGNTVTNLSKAVGPYGTTPLSDREAIKMLSNIIRSTNKAASRSIGNIASNTMEVTSKWLPLPGIQEAQSDLALTKDYSKYESAVKAITDIASNALFNTNGSQYNMMAYNDETNTITSANIKDRTSALQAAQTYLINHPTQASSILGMRPVDGKIALSIKVPIVWNAAKNKYVEGDVPATELLLFGVDYPELKNMESDTNYKGATKYDRLSRINNSRQINFDDNEISFVNGTPFINGNPTTRDKAVFELGKDVAYKEIKDYLYTVRTPDNTFVMLMNKFAKDYYGVDIRTDAGLNFYKALTEKMANELGLNLNAE